MADTTKHIVRDGASEYVIVVRDNAHAAVRFAAEELVSHIRQMSGAEIEVVEAAGQLPEKAFLIGDVPQLTEFGVRLDGLDLKAEQFLRRSARQAGCLRENGYRGIGRRTNT